MSAPQLSTREIYQNALSAARAYTGTQSSLDRVVAALGAFERAAQEVAAKHKLAMCRDKLERKIAHAYSAPGEKPRNVKQLLGLAIQSFGHRLHTKQAKIGTVDTGFCFIPTPGGPGLPSSNADSATPFKVVIQPRTDRLILELVRNGIHIDYIRRFNGSVRPSMLRKVPYTLLQIAPLNREVLICDQVGNAAFVGEQLRGPLFWATYRKEQLTHTEGIEPFDLHGNWPERLVAKLLGDNQPKPNHKNGAARRYPLTADIVLHHALEHARHDSNGRLPTQNSGGVDNLTGEKWQNWQQYIPEHPGIFYGAKGLSDLFNLVGLKRLQKEDPEAIEAALRRVDETGDHGLVPGERFKVTADIVLHHALRMPGH
jgi:hypothetical protein